MRPGDGDDALFLSGALPVDAFPAGDSASPPTAPRRLHGRNDDNPGRSSTGPKAAVTAVGVLPVVGSGRSDTTFRTGPSTGDFSFVRPAGSNPTIPVGVIISGVGGDGAPHVQAGDPLDHHERPPRGDR